MDEQAILNYVAKLEEAIEALRGAKKEAEKYLDELGFESHYILIAEGGGWPTHAIGPLGSYEVAEAYMTKDNWRESWGGITTDPKDLKIIAPDQEELKELEF